MKKSLAVLMTLAAVLFFGADRADAVLDVEARYWFTDLDAVIRSGDGTTGTDIDFVKDLGMDDKKGFPEGRVTLELGSSRFRYAYTPLKWSGANTITTAVTFNGVPYTATTYVESELKLDYHRIGYEYDFINTLGNRLGVILELKYFDGRATLNAPSATPPLAETYSFSLPVPAVGVAAQVGLPFLITVGGEVTGMTYGGKAHLYDAEAGVNYKPAPFVVVSAGYRIFKLKYDDKGDLADLSLKGPYLMVMADF